MHRLTRLALTWPATTLLVAALITTTLGVGVTRLRTDAGFRSYLGPDHPSVRQLDAFIERFGGGLPAAIVWSCEQTSLCGSVFDPPALRMCKAIAERLEEAPGVERVESPATSPLLVREADGIAIRRFFRGDTLAEDRDALGAWALADPTWRRRLVSDDGTVGAIFIQLASSDSDTNRQVVSAMLAAIAPFEARGYTFHLVGDPVGFVVAGEDLRADAERLVPAILALLLIVVFTLFRSWKHAFLTVTTVSLALVWTLGSAGWLGWPQTAVSQALGPFVLVIGVCDAIHLLSQLAGSDRPENDPRGAILAVSEKVSRPCTLTTLTTAAGFLSFSGAGIESFSHFGCLAALGTVAALFLTFSFLPAALLLFVGDAPGSRDRRLRTSLAALYRSVAAHRWIVGGGTMLLLAGSVVGLAKLRLDIDLVDVFGEHSRVVRWRRFSDAHLASPGALEIELVSRESSFLTEPRLQEKVREIQRHLASLPGIGSTRSIFDVADHVRELLREPGSPGGEPTEASRVHADALFLLSLAQPEFVDRWMSLDGRRVRISADAELTPARTGDWLLARVEDHLNRVVDPSLSFVVTGSFVIQHDLLAEVQALQLFSFGLAWIVIGTLLAWVLGSLRLGALGMISTTVPVLVTLGVMGFWGINLDIGTAMVGAVILGIAVDDTIHLLSVYQDQRRAGVTPGEAIREAMLRVGHAVVTTSLALILGFFAMTVSSWQSVASFGLLSGIAILVALVADLVLLPALVLGWAGPAPRRARAWSSGLRR